MLPKMDDKTQEHLKLKVDLEHFPLLCRICLTNKGSIVFRPNLLECYARLLNVAEVMFRCNMTCLVSISIFLAKKIFKEA